MKDFVDHIDYVVKKIGIDHVGISSDFDGGGGVDGWNGADETFNVTLELVRRGYTEEQIAKIWSGNLLRVMDEVQKVADEPAALEVVSRPARSGSSRMPRCGLETGSTGFFVPRTRRAITPRSTQRRHRRGTPRTPAER